MSRAPLDTPFKLGELSLPNRIVMAPLTRGRAGEQRVPNALMAEYYAQRASAGLIIAEATAVCPQGNGWVDAPGIYNDEQVKGWAQVVSEVHRNGARIVLQLWHMGRASHSIFHQGALPVAPSAIAIQGKEARTAQGNKPYEIPRALETEEIPGVIDAYVQAAIRAQDAGFDGVEVHAANGYLPDQFLQSKSNHRTDAYGGSIADRFRFLREIVEGCVQKLGADKVGVRISPNGSFNDMGSPEFVELFSYVAKELDAYPLAYLHVMDGLAFGFHEQGEAMTLRDFRSLFSRPMIGNCGYDFERAQAAIHEGVADLIAFGRAFISNPDLVERYRHGHPLASWEDNRHWYTAGEQGYTTYPKFKI